MDRYSYINHDEPRTAGMHESRVKSVQSWKTSKGGAKTEIIATLGQATEEKTANFAASLKHVQAYAPTHHTARHHPDAYTFSDVVDVVNPLHHIPIVGMVYREVTGDDLHPMSGIIGGALYGGPVGAVTGTVNAISKVQTGKDIGQHGLDLFG